MTELLQFLLPFALNCIWCFDFDLIGTGVFQIRRAFADVARWLTDLRSALREHISETRYPI